MELGIIKVANGYLVQIPGNAVTSDITSLMPSMFPEQRRMHSFVFADLTDMLVFLHHMFEPPIVGHGVVSKVKEDVYALRDAAEEVGELPNFLKKLIQNK